MNKNKKTGFSDRLEEGIELRNKIKAIMKKKDYLVTVYQEGDILMGNTSRMVSPRRFYQICSLDELPELIRLMREPFWNHPDLKKGMSKKEIEKIPFEEKEWGIYYDLNISPLSEEKVEQIQHDIESGLLDAWREYGQQKNEEAPTSA